ncbi:hypothetical protein ACJX0J_034540 [Zea mays]
MPFVVGMTIPTKQIFSFPVGGGHLIAFPNQIGNLFLQFLFSFWICPSHVQHEKQRHVICGKPLFMASFYFFVSHHLVSNNNFTSIFICFVTCLNIFSFPLAQKELNLTSEIINLAYHPLRMSCAI